MICLMIMNVMINNKIDISLVKKVNKIFFILRWFINFFKVIIVIV